MMLPLAVVQCNTKNDITMKLLLATVKCGHDFNHIVTRSVWWYLFCPDLRFSWAYGSRFDLLIGTAAGVRAVFNRIR